ncbi:outer membrane protein assembly factor BamC [Pusillimonas sp. MFBS29]|uniref:outer membrane protein assembly factor BamC n=1 Tax=Pusillimonas sp. MFBS29 TaxID=2886690 RepID=UPI001D12D49F|nr:outer membrane protein assembly factor BamC [Pusillimonas sp. MFBS29]MCC2596596.1 outer membrane protein assembly factor BamC [Pusillimonas sp. MFBS29]
MRMNKRCAGITLGLGMLVLSGCSTLNQALGTEEAVDYKSTVAGDPLSIPPDLTQANRDARYRAPEGTTTFSQYAQNQQQEQNTSASERILPQTDGIQVKRDGDLRWLVVDQPAEEVYPKIVEFWGEQGFTIHSQDPRAGLMETDWAENRAKIPEGWIRNALGSIIESVYDSGERERFRTRLERVNGATEIYISHDHMVETAVGSAGSGDVASTFKWAKGEEDPGLNAAMLARLMVYLGTDVRNASAMVAQAERTAGQPQVIQSVEGQASLTLAESFDRAWRRVGVAIDSAGFSLEDRNRSSGDYFIRYLDSDTGEKIVQQNFMGRLFGTRNTAEAVPYRIHVADQGSSSLVTVLDQNGQVQNTETAKRIINVLVSHMQ